MKQNKEKGKGGLLIAAVDLGTTSLKIAAFSTDGVMEGRAILPYSLKTPRPCFVESDPDIYMESVESGFRSLASQGVDLQRIAAVGFSCQSETMVFADKNGKPLCNFISWMDNRAVKQAEYLSEKYGDEQCYIHTGQVGFAANWPAAKVLWMKENEPEIFRKTDKVALLEDYIIYQLTGRWAAECSMLSSTLYWDIREKNYWKLMLDEMGLSERHFPEIMESGEIVGEIRPEMAERLGLRCGTKICTGAMDNGIGSVGAGALHPGILSESIGSTLAVCMPMNTLSYDPGRRLPIHYYPINNTYMIHTFTSGGICLQWFRDCFCCTEKAYADLSGEDVYDLMTREASKVAAGADGLCFLPHLNGSQAPDRNTQARGVFLGISLMHGKGHFIRAIMESIGYLIRRNIEAISDMGIRTEEVRAFGGGSRSPLWNQIKADILQRPVCVTSSKEAACLGAAMLAGKAAGIFDNIEEASASMVKITARYEPDPKKKDVYDNGYAIYKKLQEDCREVFEMASSFRFHTIRNTYRDNSAHQENPSA